MSQKASSFHFIIDQQDIEKLKKMVDEVSNDLNSWIDVTYPPESDEPVKESSPFLEFVEML